MNTRDEELMQVLCGEKRAADLSDAADRSRAEAGEKALRMALAAPMFEPYALRTALKKIDFEQQPRPSTQGRAWIVDDNKRVSSRARFAWITVAALIVLWIGASIVLPMLAPVRVGRKHQLPAVELLADGSWHVGKDHSISPSRSIPATLVSGGDGTVFLQEGRADVVSDGSLDKYTRVLSTIDDQLVFHARGKARYSVRLIPGMRIAAVSVFEGATDAVVCVPKNSTNVDGNKNALFSGGSNNDALISLEGRAVAMRWLDTSAKIPPAVASDIYLRLTNGRLLRGVVSVTTPLSVQVQTRSAKKDTTLPETVLAEEIAGWVPAETPRGRDTYSQWISDLLPKQLEQSKVRWHLFLAARDVNFDEAGIPETIVPEEMQFPDIQYSIRKTDNGLFVNAKPQTADLGPAWEMDEPGAVKPVEKKAGGDAGF